MGNAAGKGGAGPTGKDIKAYQDQTNFNKIELKKVIAAFDKEANKVSFGVPHLHRCGRAVFLPSFSFFANRMACLTATHGSECWVRVCQNAQCQQC